jgi:hypothetical protein
MSLVISPAALQMVTADLTSNVSTVSAPPFPLAQQAVPVPRTAPPGRSAVTECVLWPPSCPASQMPTAVRAASARMESA